MRLQYRFDAFIFLNYDPTTETLKFPKMLHVMAASPQTVQIYWICYALYWNGCVFKQIAKNKICISESNI